MKARNTIFAIVAAASVCRTAAALDVDVLPGESRVISHAYSASRDTGLLAYQVLPHVVLSCGGDLAVLGFRFSGLDLRAGLFGLIEIETAKPEPLNFLTVPGGTYLWRGLLGYSLALGLVELGERWLGRRGAVEAAVAFRHESEHYTGSYATNAARWALVPNIGDLVLVDVALRKVAGPVDIEARIQNKFFLPSSSRLGYSEGPGADLIFRFRALDWLHPFLSLFAEYLFGTEADWTGTERTSPDNYTARAHLGVAFPGRTADLQLYLATSIGNGKGLLAFEEAWQIGWGIRIGFFKESLLAPAE